MKEELKFVVDNSEYVSINYKKINEFINQIGTPSYEHWYKKLNMSLPEEKQILLAFLIESMNFCFWRKPKWKIEYNNQIYNGSNSLFFSVIKEVEKNKDFLDINYLYNLKKEDLHKIFSPVEGEIPLLDERYKNLKEVISFVYNNKDFYKELYQIKSDIKLIEYITKNINCFNDMSKYKGKIIHFNKRATLLANDLFHMSETIKNNIKNVNNLCGCADYAIPRTFRDYGILEYSKELEEIIDNEKELPHDSNMEIEIRASMLYVIELIKEDLANKNISINSVELDNIIWLIGKQNQKHKSEVHHTVTIFY